MTDLKSKIVEYGKLKCSIIDPISDNNLLCRHELKGFNACLELLGPTLQANIDSTDQHSAFCDCVMCEAREDLEAKVGAADE